MTFKLIDSGVNLASTNMAKDFCLLQNMPEEELAILHFYEWQNPSATYGYFCKPEVLIDLSAASTFGLEIAQRPTGGGMIFHAFDFAFSFLLSSKHPAFSQNTLDNYAFINRIIAKVLKNGFLSSSELTLQQCENVVEDKKIKQFCMAKPTIYDVLNREKKVAGGAQRRTKKGFLHQASISLLLPPHAFLESLFGMDSPIVEAMKKSSAPLIVSSNDADCPLNDFLLLHEKPLKEIKKSLKSSLFKEFQLTFNTLF